MVFLTEYSPQCSSIERNPCGCNNFQLMQYLLAENFIDIAGNFNYDLLKVS